MFKILPIVFLLTACTTVDPSVTLRSGFCPEVTAGQKMREQLLDISLKEPSFSHCPEAWGRMQQHRQNSALKVDAHKWD